MMYKYGQVSRQRSTGEIQEAVLDVLARNDDHTSNDLTAILIEVLVDIRDVMSAQHEFNVKDDPAYS